MTRKVFTAISVALLIAAASPRVMGQVFTSQQPARDTSAAPTTGTAIISGRLVTDESTPAPIRRARVVAQSVESDVNKWVMTDAAGSFSINDLPEGRYTVSATKPGFVRVVFGAKRFDRPGTPVGLANGQRAEAPMRMLRGAVISGIVRDEHGMPAPGVSVRAMQFRTVSGERTLANATAGAGVLGETTDDRGMYRLFGLTPGEYVISATPRDSGRGNLKQMNDALLRTAQQTLRPNTTTIGAGQAAAQAPTPDSEVPTVGFTPMYYPGTMLPTDGALVTVGAGEEREGVDIQLRVVRTSRVSGKVITPAGVAPGEVSLTIAPAGTGGVNVTGFVSINTAPVAADGTFSFPGIAPGAYTVTARAASRAPGQPAPPQPAAGPMRIIGMGGAGDSPMNLWANADVAVDGQNVAGITLALQDGMRFAGRLAFDGSRPAPTDDLRRARIQLLPASLGRTMVLLGGGGAQVDDGGRFAVTGITPGKYRVLATLPSPEANWTLKSALVKGRDVLDFPLEILPNEDVTNAVLTFTDLSQIVSGSLQDATGRPAPDYTIVVFPADRTLWSATRRIRTTRPGTDGRFVFNGLPPGSYRIAALVDLAPNDTSEPSFFEELVPLSVAFTLKDGQTHVQDLRIGR